jgi:xylulokinase
VAESEIGCALGAARLARMAAGESIAVARPATRLRSFTPRADRVEQHARRHARWQRLYPLARDFAR